MRYVKLFGVAAMAAAALMALVGVGTASAAEKDAVLCKSTATPCTGEQVYGVGTEVTGTSTNATLTAFGGFSQTVCEHSTIGGKIENSATTPHGNITEMTFTKCNNLVTIEEVTPGSGVYGELTLHHDAEHNGTVTAGGFKVTVHAGLTCTFGGSISEGITATGGTSPEIDATANLERIGGSVFCPSKGVWHANYVLTKPTPAYISTETL